MKKVLSILLILILTLSLAACGGNTGSNASNEGATTDESSSSSSSSGYKIAIYTNTVSQNEEEFRSGEQAQANYPDIVITQTMPDNFMKEQETLIANALSLV